MKKLALLLLLTIVLSGCGKTTVDSEEIIQDDPISEETEVDEEQIYTDYSMGGITFKVPVEFAVKEGSLLQNEDDSINLKFEIITEGLSDEKFLAAKPDYDKAVDEKIAEILENGQRTKALDSTIAGFTSISYCYKGRVADIDISIYYEVISNTKTNQLIGCEMYAAESAVPEAEKLLDYMKETAEFTGASDWDKELNEEATDISTDVGEGVDPDLVAFLSEYESFVDKYVLFMEKYSANPTNMELLSQYAEVMDQYLKFSEAIEKYHTNEMSTEDAAYYLEVTTRCSKKMLEVAAVIN